MVKCNATMLVRNRLALTKQSMSSLMDGASGLNLTILDDASDAETRDWLQEVKYTKGVYVVRNNESRGTGLARNQVIYASEDNFGRSGYLYLSDNDILAEPGWLDTLIYCYEAAWRKGFRVVGAYNHPYHQPSPGVKVGRMTEQGAKFYEVQEVNALALQSMLMRWCVWDDFGPFCKTPVDKVCQSEDVDFTNKLHAAGYKIGVVAPALVVSTGITNTFGEKIPGWELVKAQAPPGVIVE